MGSLQRLAAYLGAFAAIAWVMVALSVAQTAGLPPEISSYQTAAEAAMPGSGANKELGDRLIPSNGLIRPPSGVDPGLTRSPPQTGSSRMPVIPPRGTPGGDADIDPK